MYKGSFRLAQFYGNPTIGGTDWPGIVTLNQLITLADEASAMQTGLSISSALVNDYVIPAVRGLDFDTVTDELNSKLYGSEIVHYVILQKPAINITTGANTTFSMIGEGRFNSVIQASAQNLLLYRTFKSVWLGKQDKEVDFAYQGPNSLLHTSKPPGTVKELRRQIKIAADHPDHTEQIDTHTLNYTNPLLRGVMHEGDDPHDISLISGTSDHVRLQDKLAQLEAGENVQPFFIPLETAATMRMIRQISHSPYSKLLTLPLTLPLDVPKAQTVVRQMQIMTDTMYNDLERYKLNKKAPVGALKAATASMDRKDRNIRLGGAVKAYEKTSVIPLRKERNEKQRKKARERRKGLKKTPQEESKE